VITGSKALPSLYRAMTRGAELKQAGALAQAARPADPHG